MCDLEGIGVPSLFKLIRKSEALENGRAGATGAASQNQNEFRFEHLNSSSRSGFPCGCFGDADAGPRSGDEPGLVSRNGDSFIFA